MMRRHYLNVRHGSVCGIFGQFITPLILAVVAGALPSFKWFHCGHTGDDLYSSTMRNESDECKQLKGVLVPLLYSLIFIPILSQNLQSFVTLNMLSDKETKARETLQLMSLSRWAYGVSYLIFVGLIAVVQALIVSAGFIARNDAWFDEKSMGSALEFLGINVLMVVASVPYSMVYSTFFSDKKLALFLGYLITMIPTVLIVWLMQTDIEWAKYLIFVAYLFPTSVPVPIIVQLFSTKSTHMIL